MTERISRNELYFAIARSVALRSTCQRANVGAVLVRGDRILSIGYNGSPKGEQHCIEVGCDMDSGHCVRTVHAEINAILNAAINGVSTDGSFLFCTHKPCFRCLKLMKNAGITGYEYIEDYDDGRNA